MITAETFMSIEASLTKRLVKDLSLATKEVYSKVSEALASGDTDLAMQEFNRLSLAKVFAKNKPYILYVTNMAMLFGASRVTQQPGTSVVGMGFEKMSAIQLANALEQMILQKGETFLKTEGAKYIMPLEVVQKANPYHDELGRFATEDGSANTVKIGGKSVEINRSKYSKRVGEKLVRINVEAFDKQFAKSREFYVGPNGEGEIKGRYAKFGRFVNGSSEVINGHTFDTKPAKTVEASEVYVNEYGEVQFSNGRHRYAYMRDNGVKSMPVAMSEESIKNAKKFGYITTRKAERILQPFQSFMDNTGKAFIQLASSLHTSRVSAYGFTAEAMALGMEEYQITEQLDKRTCPVCRLMHGKKFKVRDARALLDIVTRSVDPDDLKQLQPWPSQTKAAVEEMAKLEPRELVANGWHIPPFHPLCRGLLTRVGKAPNLDQVKAGTYKENYDSSREDFKALGVSCNEEQLKLWNNNVGLAPGEVIARLTGTPIDEFFSGLIDAPKPKEYSGLYSLSIAKNITIRLTKKGFGSVNTFDQGVMIKPSTKSLYLDAMDLAEVDQGSGIAKRYMREFYSLAKDMELQKMELVAGLDMGGYAWAKYGFYPFDDSWPTLKKDIIARYAQIGDSLKLSPQEQIVYDTVLASSDPKSIFSLSDATFGNELLRGQLWAGSLPLDDKESVTRFLSYIGELK